MLPLLQEFILISALIKFSYCDKSISTEIYITQQYHLESLCHSRDHADIYIDRWKVAILKYGYFSSYPPIKKCNIKIITKKDYLLTAAIEYMKIRGKRDHDNKWQCDDYVEFASPPTNKIGKIFSAFDLNFFNARKSEELCGEKRLDGRNLEGSRITDLSTDANSFTSYTYEMTLDFKQKIHNGRDYNNSFAIVFTSFVSEEDEAGCRGKHVCKGRDSFCIDASLVCDGHVNCAFPGSGSDEKGCYREEASSFNITTLIIISLSSITLIGCLLCVLVTFIYRIKRHFGERRPPTPINTFSGRANQPTAPSYERSGTLPLYETVILSELEQKDENIEDHPPKYESLFPEGETVAFQSPSGNS